MLTFYEIKNINSICKNCKT